MRERCLNSFFFFFFFFFLLFFCCHFAPEVIGEETDRMIEEEEREIKKRLDCPSLALQVDQAQQPTLYKQPWEPDKSF